jgi:hypothetical protein
MPKITPETAAQMAEKSHAAQRRNTVERRILDLVAAAPPLSDDQRRKLALILQIRPADLPGNDPAEVGE